MASTEPAGPGGSRAPEGASAPARAVGGSDAGGTGPVTPPPTGGRGRWWWLLLVALLVAAVVLAVAQPWADHETEPDLPATTAPSPTVPAPTPTPAASPSPAVTTAPPTPPVPGADAVFDDASMRTLFVRRAVLEETVPGASAGLETTIPFGDLPWGLPEGSSIEPPQCTAAVTVVAQEPAGYAARALSNDRVDFLQQTVRLTDAGAARDAFRDLVTTIDGCPQYTQVNPGIDGASWDAQPAIEGQGVYPAVVQEVVHTAEGRAAPAFRGHLLVGNVIVTWTATALGDGSPDDLRAELGSAESLSTMVQDQAQDAVARLAS